MGSEEACLAAFSELSNNRVRAVNAASEEDCGCERYERSEKGVVDDAELLHFIVPAQAVADNGHLLPTYILPVDRGGLSTLREGASDREFEVTLEQLNQRWAGPPVRCFHGIFTFKAGHIRYAGEERADRLVCVYDTPEIEKPSHADVMGPDLRRSQPGLNNTQEKKQQQRRIKALIDRIGPAFEPAQSFRGGVLAHFARRE